MRRSPDELIDADDLLAKDLQDPAFRAEWDRLAVPRNLALYLFKLRSARGLTETAFARQLGMSQPAYARLDLGEHVPTIPTLRRLANALGVTFRIDIRPDGARAEGDLGEIVELWPTVEVEVKEAVDDDQLRSAAD